MTDRSRILIVGASPRGSFNRLLAAALVACAGRVVSAAVSDYGVSLAARARHHNADPNFRLIAVKNPPKGGMGRCHDARLLAPRVRRLGGS